MTPAAPTVGADVLYANRLSDDTVEISAAKVTRVSRENPFLVNLRVWGGDGTSFPRSSVWFFDGPAEQMPEGTWRFP